MSDEIDVGDWVVYEHGGCPGEVICITKKGENGYPWDILTLHVEGVELQKFKHICKKVEGYKECVEDMSSFVLDRMASQIFDKKGGYDTNTDAGTSAADETYYKQDTQKRNEILDSAKVAISTSSDRHGSYGDPHLCHAAIAEIWSAYLGQELSKKDVVHLMILLKVARCKDGGSEDTYVDICGYAALGGEM